MGQRNAIPLRPTRRFPLRATFGLLAALLVGVLLPMSPVAAQPVDVDALEALTDRNNTVNRRRPQVLVLRRLLAAAGIDVRPSGPEDRYDADLVEAVRLFQEREGIPSTGLPGARTRERLARFTERTSVAPVPSPPPVPPPASPAPQQGQIRLPPAPAPAPPTAVRPPEPPPASAVPIGAESIPMVTPTSATMLSAQLERYLGYARNGGFPRVPTLPGGTVYRLGTESPHVAMLIRRLVAEGFLGADHPAGRVFDANVRDAVIRFQTTRGLIADGVVGRATLVRLNVPVATEIAAIRASLTRFGAISRDLARRNLTLDGRYVLINAAAGLLQVVENGQVIHTEPVVIGQAERQTPEFVARLTDIRLNPTWTPTTRMIREIWSPREAQSPGTLEQNFMRPMRGGRPVDPATVDWNNPPANVTLVQRPGGHNALGAVRFGHDNAQRTEYYMHGTPNIAAFRRAGVGARLLSSGCVRLQDPVVLAEVLLRGSPEAWTAERLRQAIRDHDGSWERGQQVVIRTRTPVIWTYLTAFATPDGRVHFRQDVYERDTD